MGKDNETTYKYICMFVIFISQQTRKQKDIQYDMHVLFFLYKMHVQHMLRETNLSNQVKMVNT